eukprot:TRINITY_DN1426_c0_g1_i1.p1 TRINITY_DN1426_c0_g1~~TRINITY_DN1426_c0_g1_i1.p1  ORF type:complete len:332 (-),score=21.52 TRINITY_DN1426_c0_g1_i1:315-1310(-)
MRFSNIALLTVLCFALLLGLGRMQTVSTMNCIPVKNYILYGLTGIRNQTGDYKIKVSENTTISWNLCGPTFDYCPPREAYANIFFNNNQSCAHLTTNDSYQNIYQSMIDDTDPEKGFQIIFTNGDIYTPTDNYNFSLKIWCDPQQENVKQLNWSLTGASLKLEISSKYGCPRVNPSQIWGFIANNQWLFAICSISMGIVLCFFGYRLITISFFLLGFCLSFVPIMYIFFAFFVSDTTSGTVKWIVCLVSLAIGAAVGFICVKLEKVGFFSIGFGLAYVGANVLYVAFLSSINVSHPEVSIHIKVTHKQVLFFIIWILGGFACGYLVSKFPM